MKRGRGHIKKVTTGRSRGSVWHTVSSLWDTLGLSMILGLIMMSFGSNILKWDKTHFDNLLTAGHVWEELKPLIWAVITCLGMAYAKVASEGDPTKTAGAGMVSAVIAALITNPDFKGAIPDEISVVRIFFYPVLAWTVVELERLHLASLASAWMYLASVVLIPGILVGVIQSGPDKEAEGLLRGVAEVVFSVGCAMILHAKKVRAE